MGRRLLCALALACALAAIGPAPPGRTAAGRQAVVSPGVYRVLARGTHPRVVVALRPSVGGRRPASAHALVAAVQRRVLARAGHGLTLGRRYRSIPAFSGRVDRAALRRLASSPDVAAISMDRRVHADVTPASLALIKADQAQAAGFTGAGVTVAILGSGVDTDHPQLADRILRQACFVS